jgi:hypothetical protein
MRNILSNQRQVPFEEVVKCTKLTGYLCCIREKTEVRKKIEIFFHLERKNFVILTKMKRKCKMYIDVM